MLVAVTGASGFVGSQVVQVLLDRGHSVRGTVRDLNNTAKVAPLTELPGSVERLELVAADLLAPESFAGAFRGCEIVMHVASPYVIDVDDPQRDSSIQRSMERSAYCAQPETPLSAEWS